MDDLERLKQTCVHLPDGQGDAGTGYLLAPRRVGTAAHVVERWRDDRWYDVALGVGEHLVRCRARRLKVDVNVDAAILELDADGGRAPLQVGAAPPAKAPWAGRGFPKLAAVGDKAVALPLSGIVEDPDLATPAGSVLLLTCDQAAGGNASPMHGWSGSPVLVDGALAGHLTQHFGDVDDRRRPAFGYVRACPIEAVVALLDVPAQRALVRESRAEAAAIPVDPDIPALFSWCDRAEIFGKLSELLENAQSPAASLLCIVGHADNKPTLLMERMADELKQPPRAATGQGQPPPRCVKTFHVRHDFAFDSVDKLRRRALSPLNVKADEQVPAIMGDSAMDLLMLCDCFDCEDWSATKVRSLLRNAAAWVGSLDVAPRRFVFVLTLRFGTPSFLARLLRRPDGVAHRVRTAFLNELAASAPLARAVVGGPFELGEYKKDDLRRWLDLDRVRSGLGSTAADIDEEVIDRWFAGRKSCGHGELMRLLKQHHNAKMAQARSRS